jgi:uncharacterized SAM-dependent methyltransferase
VKYYRNTQLAKLYHVSEKSVRNWIQSALEGKLELELQQENGKPYIANTSKNMLVIEQQAQKGKKYKNSRAFKIVTPSKEFYELYNRKQILDIISHLTVHHEIPLQYGYVNGGAEYWDEYAKRLDSEASPNIFHCTVELLEMAQSNIDLLTNEYQLVNVVDLGPGNAMTLRSTLDHLLKQGRLKKYIAVDISPKMLEITKRNIKEWFGDKVNFEGHVRDFSYERFHDLFAGDYADGPDETPANLVFLLGGTLSNFRSPAQALHAVNNSMGVDDILVYSAYLDTPKTRRYFDFNVTPNQGIRPLALPSRLTLSHLNIDESLYDIEQIYNEVSHARTISILPKLDLSVNFELDNGRRIVELRKGEPILIWRHHHFTALGLINQFDVTDFELQQAIKSKEQEYFLLISKIKTNN